MGLHQGKHIHCLSLSLTHKHTNYYVSTLWLIYVPSHHGLPCFRQLPKESESCECMMPLVYGTMAIIMNEHSAKGVFDG